ncbi:Type 1 glutamine amidotransferase-like domain-containing protein [Patescibacteria group bacterium]|nr:Type 1 glutamine amidotransferase-like domain-containing protein [Patescibacteria group bacterium]MBP9710506.1 Type 1 glutamine amidotransferase-like domain-containing protein [Patescibacteria group bacterium]
MKLLLTSDGLSNPSIVNALQELVGKPFQQASVAFIPTAANVYRGDKQWIIEDLRKLQELGFRSIDLIDISAVEKDLWLPGFESADVLLFEGGSTFHLMEWIKKSGLEALLSEMLKTKVYVGISAGTIVAGRSLDLEMTPVLYGEPTGSYTEDKGLGFFDTLVRVHVNSPSFPEMTFGSLDKIAKEQSSSFYAIDDQTAIKVVDGVVEVISEGEWKKYN